MRNLIERVWNDDSEKGNMTDAIISNTGPLINLGKADRIDLIPKLFSQSNIIIPEEVFEEIQRKQDKISDQVREMIKNRTFILLPKGISNCQEETQKIAINMAMEHFNQNPESLDPKKHLVESYVIHLGEKMNASFVLLDETAAQKEARKKGLISLKHTDLIDRCVKKNIINNREAKNIIQKLINSGVKYKNPEGLLDKYDTGND